MASALIASDVTSSIIGAYYEVYRSLGYGFLERIYQAALEEELRLRGHQVERQVPVTIEYKHVQLGTQRLDMIVDQRVVVEIKSTYDLPAAANRQVLNYLRATGMEVGLLLHFGPEPQFRRLVYARP